MFLFSDISTGSTRNIVKTYWTKASGVKKMATSTHRVRPLPLLFTFMVLCILSTLALEDSTTKDVCSREIILFSLKKKMVRPSASCLDFYRGSRLSLLLLRFLFRIPQSLVILSLLCLHYLCAVSTFAGPVVSRHVGSSHLRCPRLVCYLSIILIITRIVFGTDLLLCGDVETNPGPVCKFPCAKCEKPVKSNQKGIQCDGCDRWFHIKCGHLPSDIYSKLSNSNDPWFCSTCCLPPLSDSFFNSPSHSLSPLSNSSKISDCSDNLTLPNRPSGTQIVHINIRSLIQHIDELRCTIFDLQPDIIAVSETWLDDTILDNEIHINGYNVSREDRNCHGGGVAIYTRDFLQTKSVTISCGTVTPLESTWLEVSNKTFASTILIGCCYRPPSSPPSSIDHLFLEVEEALSRRHNVIICGDLNINLSDGDHPHKDRLLHFIGSHNLCQPISSPTRVTNASRSLIDVFLVSNVELIDSSGVSDLAISDHLMIFLNLTWKRPKVKAVPTQKRSFKKFDKAMFCQDLEKAPWSVMDIFDSPDDKLYVFEELVNNCLDIHAPWTTSRGKKRRLPWISPTIQKAIDSRNKLCRRFKNSSCPDVWSAYKKQRNIVTRLLRDSKKSYFMDMIIKSSSPTVLWKCLKSVHPSTSETWDMFNCDHLSLANDFNRHFVSVSSVCPFPSDAGTCLTVSVVPCPPSMASPPPTSPARPFELQAISCDQCCDLIDSLQANKSTGPDNIPSSVLKCAKSIMAPPLTSINSSFSSGCFPNRWKRAWVKPLHKGGIKDQLTNYRPISLLPNSSKLIEQVVRTQLNSHLESNNFIHPLQFGFRKKHSTATTLLRSTNDWFNALDKGLFVGVIFLDVSKAFDSVDHGILLSKLSQCGAMSSTLQWFESYLSDRSQCSVIAGTKSQPLPLTAGVPQGSVLGPNLFSVHINDLPSVFSSICTTVLFADDTTIYTIGSTVDGIPISCPLPSPSATSG